MIRKGATHWGATCRAITRASEAPSTLAASTYASSLTDSTIDLTTRLLSGTRVTAMATMTVVSPAPRPAMSSKARMREGSDIRTSRTR